MAKLEKLFVIGSFFSHQSTPMGAVQSFPKVGFSAHSKFTISMLLDRVLVLIELEYPTVSSL